MRFRKSGMTAMAGFALLGALAVLAQPAQAQRRSQQCLTNEEIEAKLGAAIRAKQFAINTTGLPDLPLCSGLTLAQRIQQMYKEAYPEEQARLDQAHAELVAREEAERAAQEAEARRQATAAPIRRDAVEPTRAAAPSGAPIRQAVIRQDANGNIILTTAATGLSLVELLDRIVAADSSSWMVNRYSLGNMRSAKYLTRNKSQTSYTAYGEYEYGGMFGGGTGWVKVKVADGNLQCLEFWDQPGNCRAPFHSLSQQNFVGMAQSMMSDGGSGSRSSSSDSNRDADIAEDLNRANREANSSYSQPSPPPVTPIGGSNGLYGCVSPPCM